MAVMGARMAPTSASASGIRVQGSPAPGTERVLTPQALSFVARLHRTFNRDRVELLEARLARQNRIEAGEVPDFPAASPSRDHSWKVASIPADLENRRVEITGPVERKMMINALNSGANVFMADIEDSLSPTWH